MADKRSDGQAVVVTLLQTQSKGDLVRISDFIGILMNAGSSGDQVALDIAQDEVEFAVPQSVTANVGDTLYMTAGGVITNTSSGNRAFAKVTVAKDSNNIVWAIRLPQA